MRWSDYVDAQACLHICCTHAIMSAFTALGPIQCFVCYCTVAHCFSLIDDISGDCFKFIGDILANDKKMLSFFFAVVVVVVGSGG